MNNQTNVHFYCFLNRLFESFSFKYGRNYFLTAFKIRIRRFIKPYETKIRLEGKKVIKVAVAGRITVNTMDYLGYILYSEGIYEPQIINFFIRNLKYGDNVLDIGANIGYHSLVLSKLIGTGKVFAFEPNKQIIPILYNNIQANNRSNIEVYEVGISNTNTEQDFYIPDGEKASSGQASLRVLDRNSIKNKIKLVKIDSILNSIPKIRLLKMDIEGAEGLALEGMNKFLHRDKPIIIFEYSPDFLKLLGTNPCLVIDNLKNIGYKLFVLEESISPLLLVPRKQVNILGIHEMDPLGDIYK